MKHPMPVSSMWHIGPLVAYKKYETFHTLFKEPEDYHKQPQTFADWIVEHSVTNRLEWKLLQFC